jgi:parallel beta-helix repeat protein
VLVSFLVVIAMVMPVGVSLLTLGLDSGDGSPIAAGVSDSVGVMDPGGTPHYFGPYPNYANSPMPTGAISAISIDNGGTGYTSPVIEISDVYGTGSGASATATVSGGVITDIVIVSGGTDYTAPQVAIVDPTGVDAVATALLGGDLMGGIRKFVDSLPGMGETNANNLGDYIPIAVADRVTYPGCEYYEIAVVQYTQQMHSDLPPTLLRGYVQLETPVNYVVSKHIPLWNPDGTPIRLANGTQAVGVDDPHYLGPTIVSIRDVPTRIKFSNLLPTGTGGDLFLPVDTTVMGSGMSPHMIMPMHTHYTAGNLTVSIHAMEPHNLSVGSLVKLRGFTPDAYNGEFRVVLIYSNLSFRITLKTDPGSAATVLGEVSEMYLQDRATLHLHGGYVPWISDGTPHQWTTPAGETTQYPKGVSVQYVPDMWFVNGTVVPNTVGQTSAPVVGATNDPGNGSLTFYYNNQQSARLMFYHDHSYGITRLNVYAGEAAAYLLTDSTEEELIDSGVVPSLGGAYRYGIPLMIQDKTFVDASTIPYQDPTWAWGSLPPGTPSTGDLWLPHVYMPNQNPFDPGGMNRFGRWHYGPWFWPPTTDIAYGPVANPYYDPVNAPWEPPVMPGVPSNSMAMEAYMDTSTVNGVAYPYLDVLPQAYRFRILSIGNDRVFNLQFYVADSSTVTWDGRANTEVKMVPAVSTPGFPELWPTDGRDGGVPDPATRGPEFIQIGTEGGFLPAPVVIENQPVTWNLDPTTFNMGNVKDHALLLGPAERADVIVDFAQFAGKTLILYNDAPAAFPALDARYDYYTGDADHTETGGAPSTQPGYGPNIRTMMQIRVADVAAAPAFNLDALNAAFASTPDKPGVFESSQDPIIVPQAAYNSAYGMTFAEDTYARIADESLTFETIAGETLTIQMEPKAIQDEMGEAFETDYGRMSGMLGLEIPFTAAGNQNFVLYGYPSPPVDIVIDSLTPGVPTPGDATQIWRITHNGVDTHTLHTHLYSMQLINRVAWDNAVIPPDLNELGWKETIRVNPLENTIVAVRAVAPTQPFEVPNSVRAIDATMPLGAVLPGPPGGFLDPNANPVTVVNHLVNFGWEYVMHCHLLGHEEMDMMHSVVFATPPFPAQGLNATLDVTSVNLTWVDDSIAETAYIVQRNTTTDPWTTIATVDSPLDATGPTSGNIMYYNDTVVSDGTVYSYRILANKVVGDTADYGVGFGFPSASVNSTPSNVVVVDTGTGNVTVLKSLARGSIALPTLMATDTTPELMTPLIPPAAKAVTKATFTSHAPIRIDSDLDFDAAHGVSSGDGTPSSPWVIEGLRIDGGGYGYGIYIGNTTESFIVRDSYLDNSSGGTFSWKYSPGAGMVLNNVTGGVVAFNIIDANGWAGVYATGSNQVLVHGNTVTGNYMGVYLRSSVQCEISNNTVTGGYSGIWLYGSGSNAISNNTIAHNYPGVVMALSSGNTVDGNSIYGNLDYGIWLHGSDANSIHGNDLIANNGAASTYSVYKVQAFDDTGTNSWNTTSEGNYWSDLTGPDADLNGIVDVPYELDGRAGARDDRPSTTASVPEALTTIVVTPTSVSVVAGSDQAFSAQGYDQYGLPMVGTMFTWSTDVGAMTGDVLTAQATAGVTGYVMATSGAVSGAASVSVIVGPLDHIDVTPSTANVVAGAYLQFYATGKDANGNDLSGLTFDWSTDVGTVTSSGMLFAQMVSGVTGHVNATVGAIAGSAVVTVIMDQLAYIVVTPGTAEVAAGTELAFSASGYDQYDNPITGLVFAWSTDIGLMVDELLTAQTTSGVFGYVRATSGAVSGNAFVTVVPGYLDSIELVPLSLSAVAGSQTQFSALGLDAFGNVVTGLTFSWDTTVGSITSSGLFTASTTTGAAGYVNASSEGITGSADVTIVSSQLTYIIVTPDDIEVVAGATQSFSATGYDQFGNEVSGVTFSWTTDVGTVDDGLLEAQTAAVASGYVRATSGVVAGQASVTVVPGDLDHIDVSPSSLTAVAGSDTQFTAIGRDVYDNAIPGLTYAWASTIGSVTDSGLFTAPSESGVSGFVNASSGIVEGSADASVVPGTLLYIVMDPSTAEVGAGSEQTFSAAGYDLYGNLISGLTFAWSTDVGTVTDGTLTAQVTAGISGYVRAASGAVSSDAYVSIIPGDLDHIEVSPTGIDVVAGTAEQFEADGMDVYNNTISGLTFEWTTDVGVVSSAGMFTAQTVSGETGTVTATSGEVFGEAEVAIVPDQLNHIEVDPSDIEIAAGGTQEFTADGYDQYGNPVTGLAFTWSTDVGTIESGILTGQTVAGGHGYVRATVGAVVGQASVAIVPAGLDHIVLMPSELSAMAGSETQFTATGMDEYGNAISGLVYTWETTVGEVSSSGLFTAQTAALASGFVNASSGGVTGSAEVTIVPGILSYIALDPTTTDVAAGAMRSFSASGYDLYGNEVPDTAFTWSTDVGTVVDGTLTAQTLAGVSGYVRAESGVVSRDAFVSIVPGPLDHIDVSPADMTVAAGSQATFTATGKDVYDNVIHGLTFSWTTTVGSVKSSGLFTAQTVSGMDGFVNASRGAIRGTAMISIVPGQLTYIVVTASAPNVTIGGTLGFSAVGYDQYGNEISGLDFVWTTNVGSMSGATLTAQPTEGAGYVRATSGVVSGDIYVTVLPGPETGMSLSTVSTVLGVVLAVLVFLVFVMAFVLRRSKKGG